jgi:hypothetical protein
MAEAASRRWVGRTIRVSLVDKGLNGQRLPQLLVSAIEMGKGKGHSKERKSQTSIFKEKKKRK